MDALAEHHDCLVQALDKAVISAAEKAKMRDTVNALGKKQFELQKASIAASKAQATEVSNAASALPELLLLHGLLGCDTSRCILGCSCMTGQAMQAC